jgi:ADP-heptose:LPS heptosyltransferase
LPEGRFGEAGMKILLVRPDGIGDQVLCLPVASALRNLMPRAHITFLSSAGARPVLDHHPDVDAVLTLSGGERFGDLVALFRKGFDAAVFLKPFPKLMIAALAAGVSTRVATGYRWYSIVANRRVYEHRHHFAKHESEYNIGMLKGLGLAPGRNQEPRLVLTSAERSRAQERLAGTPSPRIVVHPGGFSTRRWRAGHYWNLVQRIVEEEFGAILIGSAAEAETFQKDKPAGQRPPDGVLDLMGKVGLRDLMAVIAASDLLVSGSSGPTHLAAGLGRPVVSIYDPRRSQLPIRWRPLGNGVVLTPDVPTCEKCVYQSCPYWDCLDRVTVDQVMFQVRRVLERPEPVKVLRVQGSC